MSLTTRVPENLKHYHDMANCKYIMLAGSGDRGYVGFLRQFSAGSSDIGLIESVPFEPAFRSIAAHFRVERFPEIFRASKLDVATASTSYAATTSAAGTSPTAVGPSTTLSPPSATTHRSAEGSRRFLMFNKRGERLDGSLLFVNKMIVYKVKDSILRQNPCLRYHLTRCEDRETCNHSHHQSYSTEEVKALSRLARLTPCDNGKHCDDANCVAGHHCVYDGKCEWDDCRFSPEMHGIDKLVAERRQV